MSETFAELSERVSRERLRRPLPDTVGTRPRPNRQPPGRAPRVRPNPKPGTPGYWDGVTWRPLPPAPKNETFK